MSKVHNWQIDREMEYPYPAAPPKKQVAYVFDTNKCIACQTCTIACKSCWTSGRGQEHIFYNNVETKPYGSYPMGWDAKLQEKRVQVTWNGKKLMTPTIFEGNAPGAPPDGWKPESKDYSFPNHGEDDISGIIEQAASFSGEHPMWMFYLARICNHCSNPACLAACPRKAIYKRQEDGIVLVDQERCRGYQECVRACPYKKVFYNAVSRASEKCIGCFPRVEQGLQALCVEGCIGKIRMHGFITTQEKPHEDNPLDYIIHIRKLALPLYPQFGTGPNVYYVPPVHVPIGFSEQLFGPGVEESIAMYRKLKEDPKLLGALFLFGATDQIIERFEVKDEVAYGYNGKGDLAATVPFTEYSYVRPHQDKDFQVYRHNTA